MANDEFKRKQQEIRKDEMEQARTDAAQEVLAKKQTGSGMYKCKNCGSDKVSMTPMQTRSADEPMTEFYRCADCGKTWRICP